MLKKLESISLNRKKGKFIAGAAVIVAAAVLTAALVLATIAAPGSEVVARVNGEAITAGDVTKLRVKVYESYQMQISEEEALEQLIAETVLYQEADEQGYAPTMDEAEQELEARVASSGRTMEDFEADLAKSGFSYEEYLQDFQRQLAINNYLDDAVQVPEVTELEARVFYESYKQQSPEAELPPFEQLKSQIMALLEQQKRQEATSLLIEELKEKADIEYK
ncbi:MAG TPA: SurA N-terminal domain-containing protein [Dehalococcoidia bacterium]|nr:SurA N-terminal domain-containing protein [Dehalococcoidia bacterium]